MQLIGELVHIDGVTDSSSVSHADHLIKSSTMPCSEDLAAVKNPTGTMDLESHALNKAKSLRFPSLQFGGADIHRFLTTWLIQTVNGPVALIYSSAIPFSLCGHGRAEKGVTGTVDFKLHATIQRILARSYFSGSQYCSNEKFADLLCSRFVYICKCLNTVQR